MNFIKTYVSFNRGVTFFSVISLLLIATTIFSAPMQCMVNANKDPAWADYDVMVTMIDFNSKKVVTHFNLTAADQSLKKASLNTQSYTFPCTQYSNLIFTASFSPVIWSKNKGEIFPTKNIWSIPSDLAQTNPHIQKYVLQVNFPSDFLNVPALLN